MAGDEEGNPTPASYSSPPMHPAGEGGDGSGRPRTRSDAASSTAGGEAQTTESAFSTKTRGTRRDRVSVGSRMTRTVITRPPYAARDELDFERRPRSNTTGTLTGTDASDRPGRHPGVQPPLHARSAEGGTTRSQESTLSGATHAAADEKAHLHASNAAQDGQADRIPISAEKQEPDTANGAGYTNAKQEPQQSSNNGTYVRPNAPHRQPSNDASRWMAFTLPTRYRKMLDDYVTRSDSDPNQQPAPRPDPSSHHHFFGSHHHQQQEPAQEDASDYDSDESTGDYHYRYFGRKKKRRGSQSRQVSGDEYEDDGLPRPSAGRSRPSHRTRDTQRQNSRAQSRNRSRERQPQRNGDAINSTTPGISRHNSQRAGWDSPWLPNAGAEPESNVPGALHFPGLGGQTTLDTSGNAKDQSKFRLRVQQFRRWVVRSAFAPLAFRMFNLAFTAALLGVAVSIRRISMANGVMGIMGSSTIFSIVVTPLSILHIIFNLYTEYFGSPIGVWKVRSKMFYTFTELIFICLWSGLLSLSFDDLFTSPAGCTSYTPNAQYRQTAVGSSGVEGTLADQLCDRQAALVSLVFVGLILYVLVLIVSLFRIFAKISRLQ